jgi:hypothetical protein
MIKRDFTAWDFVKQEPKKGQTILFNTIEGSVLVSADNTGYVTWEQPTITAGYDNTILGSNNTIIGGEGNIVLGHGLTVTDTSNTVTIGDLVVAGSADIPPSQGELRYNIENGTTEAYIGEEWVELGPMNHYPLPRQQTKLERFKSWWRKVVS